MVAACQAEASSASVACKHHMRRMRVTVRPEVFWDISRDLLVHRVAALLHIQGILGLNPDQQTAHLY